MANINTVSVQGGMIASSRFKHVAAAENELSYLPVGHFSEFEVANVR